MPHLLAKTLIFNFEVNLCNFQAPQIPEIPCRIQYGCKSTSGTQMVCRIGWRILKCWDIICSYLSAIPTALVRDCRNCVWLVFTAVIRSHYTGWVIMSLVIIIIVSSNLSLANCQLSRWLMKDAFLNLEPIICNKWEKKQREIELKDVEIEWWHSSRPWESSLSYGNCFCRFAKLSMMYSLVGLVWGFGTWWEQQGK